MTLAARVEYRHIANEIARDCIVTDALARLLEQVVEQVLVDANKKLRSANARIAKLTEALNKIGHASGTHAEVAFFAVETARAALQSEEPTG